MANDSFNLFVSSFVSFSIDGLKESAENLNYYPLLRRMQMQMLSTATIKVSVVYLQCSLPC